MFRKNDDYILINLINFCIPAQKAIFLQIKVRVCLIHGYVRKYQIFGSKVVVCLILGWLRYVLRDIYAWAHCRRKSIVVSLTMHHSVSVHKHAASSHKTACKHCAWVKNIPCKKSADSHFHWWVHSVHKQFGQRCRSKYFMRICCSVQPSQIFS